MKPTKFLLLKRCRHLCRFITACLFCLFSPALLSAQSPFLLHHYDTKEGLSNDWVSDIFQDSRGFIWIATQYGVNRFDGYSFKAFRYNPDVINTLSVNWVRTISEDKEGNLWFGTHGGGLNVFNPRTETFQRQYLYPEEEEQMSISIVYKVLCDKQNNIWAATTDGLFYRKGKGKFDKVEIEAVIYDIKETEDGVIWLATTKGLYYRSTNTGLQPFKQGNENVTAFCFKDSTDSIWYYGEKGLSFAARDGRSVYLHFNLHREKHLANHFFSPLYIDKQQRLWVGTNLAPKLVTIFKGKVQNIQSQKDSRQGSTTCIAEDRTGNIWVGTTTGINVYSAKASRFHDERYDSAITHLLHVREVLQDGNYLWYACPEGLYRRQAREKGTSSLVLQKSVNALLKGENGKVYAGVSDEDNPGFYCIDPNTLSRRFIGKARGFTGGVIWALTEDRSGRIWVGGKGGIQCYDPVDTTFIPFVSQPGALCEQIFVLDLLLDDSGDLWIATLGCGLYRLPNPHTLQPGEILSFVPYKYESGNATSLSSNLVQCLHKTPTGDIWVGTDGGLNRLLDKKKKSFRRYLQTDGLADDKILALNSDVLGRIWAATIGHGLICLNPNEENSIINFTTNDGLFSDAFMLSSTYRSSDSILFFGTNAGLQIFKPTTILPNQGIVPNLHFSDVYINGEMLQPDEKTNIAAEHIAFASEIQLNPSHKTINIQYTALDFTNPSKTRYYYVLSYQHYLTNFIVRDTQFNQNKHEITFTNLSPGAYTLTILAVHKERNWEVTSRPLKIYMSPPIYLNKWALLFYGFFALIVLYSLYRFRVNQKLTRAETVRRRELDAVKTRLYTNITHEFRTPLTVILGEASQLENQVGEKQKGSLSAIRRQGRQLLNLVNQMLDLAKVEASSLHLNLVQGNIVLFLKYLLESFRSLSESKQVSLLFDAETDEFQMDYDPDKLQKIISNLLSNAIKFTPQGGRVTLRVTTGSHLLFQVSDTGPGIAPEKLPFIFDRFYQADDSATRLAEGTGIGLTLVKELVHLLGGHVRVESPYQMSGGKGTIFTVTLPVRRTAEKQVTQSDEFFSENEGDATKPEAIAKVLPLGKTPPHAGDVRPQLLIVEDNADVVRYLSSLLNGEYQIFTAPNGKEGLEAAFYLVPDLIISDVMMPEMDGFEVCRILKTDFRTSHIPVILLTAKADLDSRIEGLEHGADAYLAKPFEERELRVHLRKARALRQALRERYAQPGMPMSSDLPAFRREDVFFKELHSVLENRFAGETFGVSELCDAMHLSRPNLFRKLTALTGKNIEDYLRSFRLSKAHEMLRTTNATVQEVAWACGFKEPAHFTRAFQKEFGFLPSQVRC